MTMRTARWWIGAVVALLAVAGCPEPEPEVPQVAGTSRPVPGEDASFFIFHRIHSNKNALAP